MKTTHSDYPRLLLVGLHRDYTWIEQKVSIDFDIDKLAVRHLI